MTEQDAIERCRSGDTQAFAVIVQQYQAPILALCLRLTGSRTDAADMAQQAFVKAFRHINQHDPTQPFRPWLFRIATNECIAFLRHRKHQPLSTPAETLEQVGDPGDGAPALMDVAEDRAEIRRLVSALPPPYRLVVVLHYFQELTYQQIAHQTGLPVGTVSTQLFRAKQQLRRQLRETGGNLRATR